MDNKNEQDTPTPTNSLGGYAVSGSINATHVITPADSATPTPISQPYHSYTLPVQTDVPTNTSFPRPITNRFNKAWLKPSIIAPVVVALVLIASGGVFAAKQLKTSPKSTNIATTASTTQPANQNPTAQTPNTTKPIVQKPAQNPVTTKPTTTQKKRYTDTTATSKLAAATTVAQAQQAIQSFASQYNLTVQITSVTQSSSAKQFSSFSLVGSGDLGALKTYGTLFIDEWSKYPTDWVASSKLTSIILVKSLYVDGTYRAAMPDPFGKAMYYDVTFSGDYAREVVHHEFDHLFTYTYFNSYAPADPTWVSYNPAGFKYGNGGASCYQPGNTCLTGQHPIAGFVTGYGASAIEEDKAELYAYLMTGTYYHQLTDWLKTDTLLVKKVDYYKKFISSYSPEMSGDYFNNINF